MKPSTIITMGGLQEEKRYRTCNPKREEEEESQEVALFKVADLILPWLTPPELASTASSCKTLYRISHSIATARAADASRSLEAFPIPFINTTPHHRSHPYAYFIYTPSQIPTSSSSPNPPQFRRQSWGPNIIPIRGSDSGQALSNWVGMELESLVPEMGETAFGCDCEECHFEVEDAAAFACPCRSSLGSSEMAMECGPGCRCGSECGNRVTQRGISARLRIVRDSRKGWGLHAAQLMRSGEFICEYAGELLTTREARRRQQIYDKASIGGRCSSALLVVREHLPSGNACMRINIDATRVGNVARFINHRCDGGNLSTRIVRSSGVLLPRLCFFATRDVQENEELTFSYGLDGLGPNGLRCFCGSSCCSGFLPSEYT